MTEWQWINDIPKSWRFLVRVMIKALLLFGICNLTFAVTYPIKLLGHFSLYGSLYAYRTRLPYGENPSQSYNITLNNIPAMFNSHAISRPPEEDEFRIIIIGDSSTWGWLLSSEETLASQINQAEAMINNQRIVAYNLGYPDMSLTKDLLILDEAMDYQPDMIIWLFALASFPAEQQLALPLVQQNRNRLLPIINTYNLDINPHDEAFYRPSLWERTIVGQRRALADLLRLQTYGLSWSATGIDQVIPDDIELRQSDFEEDVSWLNYDETTRLSSDILALDVLAAGIEHIDSIPIILVNEPMFISDGTNSNIRYNSFYPRWAYDQYRALLDDFAEENGWDYLDLWNHVAPQEFTDSPVHLTNTGTEELANIIINAILANQE